MSRKDPQQLVRLVSLGSERSSASFIGTSSIHRADFGCHFVRVQRKESLQPFLRITVFEINVMSMESPIYSVEVDVYLKFAYVNVLYNYVLPIPATTTTNRCVCRCAYVCTRWPLGNC